MEDDDDDCPIRLAGVPLRMSDRVDQRQVLIWLDMK